jgi:hypothetical protein
MVLSNQVRKSSLKSAGSNHKLLILSVQLHQPRVEFSESHVALAMTLKQALLLI